MAKKMDFIFTIVHQYRHVARKGKKNMTPFTVASQ